MRSRLDVALIGALFFVLSHLSSPFASAQSFSFPPNGFTTTNVCPNSATPPNGCTVFANGSPSNPQVTASGNLRLTTANQNQHGAAWYSVQQPLASGFTTSFQFQITNTGACAGCSFPADGIALVIQDDPAGTGALGYTGNGQNISYGNADNSGGSGPGEAIQNALAIELDTYHNPDYGDPDGNHIAVQSCGVGANSSDHTYTCPSGSPAKIALQSLPTGLSLSDGNIHTITVNYVAPGSCTSNCNNLSVYFDSTLILQTTVNLPQLLNLVNSSSAYIGFTAATGGSVENSDIVSWSFSQWPLQPITINQPVQNTVTNFSYTSSLSANVDYTKSGLSGGAFNGVVMQGTVSSILDSDFANLVMNTPFQGSTCQHQDTGNGTYACVVTTDLCTTPTNSVPAGLNCPASTNGGFIGVSNTYNLDPSQKPLIGPNAAPGYFMGKDDALGCGQSADNTCKGLVSVFTSISGDIITNNGHTNNFNSIFIPIFGGVQPHTTVTTTPPLIGGWANSAVNVAFNSAENIGSNQNPPSPLPTITSISYASSGANPPAPSSGTINGATGSITIPATNQGSTTITYSALDSASVIETLTMNNGSMISSSTPGLTVNIDTIPPAIVGPTLSPSSPTKGEHVTATFSCSDSGSGVVSCGSAQFAGGTGNTGTLTSTFLASKVGSGTFTVNAKDLAGNASQSSINYSVVAPTVTFTPTSINFGSVNIGRQVSKTVKVKYSGAGTMDVTNVAISPITSDLAEFTAVNSCLSPLTKGQTCSIFVYYYADQTNSPTADLVITDDAPGSPQVIPLSGTGVN